jgi:hypothetical protein
MSGWKNLWHTLKKKLHYRSNDYSNIGNICSKKKLKNFHKIFLSLIIFLYFHIRFNGAVKHQYISSIIFINLIFKQNGK